MTCATSPMKKLAVAAPAAAGVAHELDLDVGIALVERGGDFQDLLRRRALVPDDRPFLARRRGEVLQGVGAGALACGQKPDHAGERHHSTERQSHRSLPHAVVFGWPPSWQTVLAGEHSPLRFGMGDGRRLLTRVRSRCVARMGLKRVYARLRRAMA
jgi:hypothetical protein